MKNNILSKLNPPIIIDGGLSNVLEAQGCDLNNELWSAHIIDTNPEAIILAHLEYLKAGSQCITTSSYQASIQGYMNLGYSKIESENLILKSVVLAKTAIKRFNKTPQALIAASIGPYGAYLADGSEYHGNYNVSDQTLYDFHYDRIKLLENTSCDVFACETIPSLQEANVISEILENSMKMAWISFSCKDEIHINDGNLISTCANLFKSHPNVFAIGVNCTAPKYISSLINEIKNTTHTKKIIVYPNSGSSYDAVSKTWVENSNPLLFSEMTKEWLNLGADLIGGCCQIGPDHINAIKHLKDDN